MTNMNMFDLDDLDRYAEKYGISVLGAGDTDQSGVFGDYEIVKQDGSPFAPSTTNGKTRLTMSLFNTNFIRTPKLGVSMRTDNS